MIPGAVAHLVEHVIAGAVRASLPAMSGEAIAKIRKLEEVNARLDQVRIATQHLIHAGMYARTIEIPAGCLLTGALVKRATILIVEGDVTIATGEEAVHLVGYHVIPASAHRKQAFVAHRATRLTMIFPTAAQGVEEAEAEFTDEADRLFSRGGENVVNVTGEL